MAEKNPTSTIAASLRNSPIATSVSETTALPKADLFLKPQSPRKRRRSPDSPTQYSTYSTLKGTTVSVSPKSLVPSEHTPSPLTGAAALADQKRRREEEQAQLGRQTSPNPARAAIGALLGEVNTSESRMQDAPTMTAATTRVAPVAPMAAKPDASESDNVVQISPTSTASIGTSGAATVGPLAANDVRVASPAEMDHGGSEDRSDGGGAGGDAVTDHDAGHSNKAMTFPGPLLSAPVNDARRGMSLPGSGLGRESQRSPSAKKHKCPYCSTDFTRHHNLKSHLLTHSHEKPYYCETCDARFRRLHDLKRHTKLHTGERPHVCPKCDRSFARGDALARHNKGQGGCAGRRSSMGSYGGEGSTEGRDGQGQEDGMHGLMYTGQASHEPEGMDDDASGPESTGRSLPSIRRHDASSDQRQPSGSDSGSYHTRQPSTYPPVAVRQPGSGGLYPPGASIGGGSSASTSPGTQPSPNSYQHGASGTSVFQHSGPNVFAQGGMTESPKPLSPGGAASHQLGHQDSGIHRNRSPSLTQQFQQQHFGRRSSTLNSSPQTGLPPPHLPSLPGLSPADPRFTLQSQSAGPAGGQTSPGFHSQSASQNNSLSSHGTGPHGGSGDNSNNAFAQSTDRIWAYIRSLENRVDRLQDEVGTLRGQLSSRQ